MSVAEMMLAMLRCTNTSPGWRPRIVVSGQRESEQPSHTTYVDFKCQLMRRLNFNRHPTLNPACLAESNSEETGKGGDEQNG